jgi:predicted O-methyltransferase YrrM
MVLANVSGCVEQYWRKRNAVVGAFWDIDFLMFDRVLRTQAERRIHGHLLEIGALYGKSAIVLGCHAAATEQVYVCDVFQADEGDAANAAENLQSYEGLTRKKFEENYQKWVGRLPTVIAELSDGIAGHVPANSLRFAHVDGGHLYNVVKQDLHNVQGLMNDDGVVVMDDVRALHTPGVAAAVWEAVSRSGLIPIAITEQKFYGAWNPEVVHAIFRALKEWCAAQGNSVNYGVQIVSDAPMLVIENPVTATARSRIERFVPPVLTEFQARHRARPYLGDR